MKTQVEHKLGAPRKFTLPTGRAFTVKQIVNKYDEKGRRITSVAVHNRIKSMGKQVQELGLRFGEGKGRPQIVYKIVD